MEQQISLDTIGGGAAVERFNLAMQEALDNIQDLNTDPKKSRTVSIKVTIKPSEDRSFGEVVVDVNASLAPLKSFGVMIAMGKRIDGKGFATEYQSPQTKLFDDDDKKVVPYKLDKEVKAR